jgi:hypothetical protein
MNTTEFLAKVWENNPHYIMGGFLIILIGAAAKARLFAKGNQPWFAAFVPIWDMIVTLRMVGRPTSHVAYFLVPGFNIYFSFKLLIEIAQSFGKVSIVDYVLVCVFNIFYVLNLALAYNEEYLGPVYGKDIHEVASRKPAMA